MFRESDLFHVSADVADSSSRLSEFDPPGVFPPPKTMASTNSRFNSYKEISGDACISTVNETLKENMIGNVTLSENISDQAVKQMTSGKTCTIPLSTCHSPGKLVDAENSILPSRLDQLEREKRELLLQSKIREEKEKAMSSHNAFLEERVRKLETENAMIEKELNLSRQEIFDIRSEKDNLAAEVRKLTRQNGQAEGQSLWGQMTSASRELCRAEEEIKTLNRDLLEAREKNVMLGRLQEKYEIKEKANEMTLQELMLERKRKAELEGELESALKDNAELSGKLADIDASFDAFRRNSDTVREELDHQISRYQHKVHELEANLRETQTRANQSARSSGADYECADGYDEDGNLLHARKRRLSDVIQSDSEFGSIIADLRQKLLNCESQRRSLHNQIQDLRGNVRVFVRCRPFLISDGEESLSDKCLTCNAEGTTVSLSEFCSRGAGQVFQFDGVYNQECRQEDLFTDVKDLVQSAMDGYRVCVFSYGQTGSGKTHTMTGSHYGDERGLIPRSIEHIIGQINVLKESGWHVNATYSMLEVYNETLVDLLDNSPLSDFSSQQCKGTKLKITMQHDRVVVQNLSSVPMNSDSVEDGMMQLRDILHQTNSARTTASTAMNDRSSRSHVLFMMNLQSIHSDGTVMEGGLRLVDLAGSERLDRTGTLADAARLRETVNINKSLSCLGDVFMALGHKASHVPYRNSKLTMLLQDCLSGEGKTLMLVNVSPTLASAHETFCSLKFASQVNQVQLGAAKKSVTVTPKIIQQIAPPLPPPAHSHVAPSPVKRSSKPKLQTSSSTVAAASGSPGNAVPKPAGPSRTKRMVLTTAESAPISFSSATYKRTRHVPKTSGWR